MRAGFPAVRPNVHRIEKIFRLRNVTAWFLTVGCDVILERFKYSEIDLMKCPKQCCFFFLSDQTFKSVFVIALDS